MTRRQARTIALSVACLVTGCREAPAALGTTPAAARSHADELFRGLGVRFVNVQRQPKFAAARGKLSRSALSPSRLMSDTSVWTGSPTPTSRLLELEGSSAGGGYVFAPRAGAAAPARAGDARHVIRLTQLGEGEFQWSTVVDHAVGRVKPEEGANAVAAWLASFQRSDRDLRADLHTFLPRTSAAFGRLFVLDTVHSVMLVDGSSVVDARFHADGKRVKPSMPALAQYVDKYVQPAKYSIQLTDGRAQFLDARLDDGAFSFRFRTRDGKLLALDGAARPMPDSLAMRVDAYEHFFIFDVGVSEMMADVVAVRTPGERGWTMHFRRAPKWHIPLAMRHLISGALDRPFQQGGMLFRVTLRDDGSQTLLARRFDVGVKESAIVRWLGGLGAGAMDDFAGRAESEENRFLADALFALRADIVAALGG